MDDKGAGSTDRRLWQRWQALGGEPRAVEPDALSLAAYAEARLVEAEAVETWLATAPEALADIVAARAINRRPPRLVFQHILGNACSLVPEATAPRASAAIVPLRARRPQWRTALAWSSIAASLVCASMIGFSMGSDAYANLSQTHTADTASPDNLEAPASLDSYFSDDTGT